MSVAHSLTLETDKIHSTVVALAIANSNGEESKHSPKENQCFLKFHVHGATTKHQKIKTHRDPSAVGERKSHLIFF
jgi:RIO-like serine/threonine protein kinase